MSEIIKSGNLLKFSNNAFNTKWKYNYVELCKNSTFRWFDKQGDNSPKRSLVLKDVSAFIAFGEIVKQLPFKPDLSPDQIDLVIAIPHENNRNTRLSFFLCSDVTEIQEWVNTILNTVTQQATSGTNNPPPKVSSGPLYEPPPTSGPSYGPPPASGPSYGPQPASGPSHGPPPASGPSYGPPPALGPSYYPGFGGSSGFNIGNSPTGPYPGQGHPGGNPSTGQYPHGNAPPGAYPQSFQPPVSYPTYPYSGLPQNRPVGPSTTYQAGQVSNANYPHQPGYVPGAPQPGYIPGAPQPGYVPGAPQPYVSGIPYNQPVSYIPGQSSQTCVIVDGKKKHRKIKNAAIGVAAGAATAYVAGKIFGGYHHGWGGHGWGDHGCGYGHYGGSWSSLSSGSWSD